METLLIYENMIINLKPNFNNISTFLTKLIPKECDTKQQQQK